MSYTALKYHIVFSTKERRRFLLPEILPRLAEYLGGMVRERKGKLLACNGPEDHIHLLASIPATVALADFIRELKCNSSSWIRETWADLRTLGWQDGYAAFTVSQSGVGPVIEYIAGQQGHHKTITFQEELIELLTRHEIEFDPRYIQA